ncbi:MAG: cyclic nucleotide-binding domain-containing protein [Spirochaetales bacterium]|nr:cyclic nucleotide-binding domain-containing protein [Spirochaetales bacterium]
MEKIKVTNGVYYLSMPEAGLFVLCGCPADVVKHLMLRGLIVARETDGYTYETGPNAILLSDVSVQNGSFSNLAEFPVLQMFYRQGMLIPGHPNNRGVKPILAGIPNQVMAQSQYIYRGTYGLLSEKELLATGVTQEMARDILKLKRAFAFGKIKKTEELLDFRVIETDPVELRNGVKLERLGLNKYRFNCAGKIIDVDMNLEPSEEYKPAVRLDFHRIKREYFSVIHTGEGNGWDINNPCMASILVFQGKIYLIDTGPNITATLVALGISINEIEGVFHTHAHDDHFAGLTTLVRSDHMIKYYATPLVRSSVTKKLSALMGFPESSFSKYFEVCDLEFNKWNNIEGLEVMPVFTPHPVENNAFFFRTFWEGGYKKYGHLADIISLDGLKKMVRSKENPKGVHPRVFYRTRDIYNAFVNLKKIDSGGGMIHGSALDFIEDKSPKIILAHIDRELSPKEKEIGSNATFGAIDILIPAHQDYSMQSASRFLRSFFPKAPSHDLAMLLNCECLDFNVGMNIIRKSEQNKHIYLLLNGVVELIDAENHINHVLSAGSMLGEYSGLTETASEITYRAKSYVKVLKIPAELYVRFINRNYNFQDIVKFHKNIWFLEGTWLFGELISSRILNKIALLMDTRVYEAGEELDPNDPKLYLIKRGQVEIVFEDQAFEKISRGSFFGEENILLKSAHIFRARVIETTKVYQIPGSVLEHIPIIEWKLLESYEKRIKAFGASAGL